MLFLVLHDPLDGLVASVLNLFRLDACKPSSMANISHTPMVLARL